MRVYAKDFDGKTKNEHFREMLIQAVANKQVKARNILFDSWYASAENLKLVERLGFTFYTTLKSNRLICREDETETYHLQELKWTKEEERYGIRIKVSKIPFTVRLFKLVATNGDIDWIITNDFDSMSTAEVIQKADKVRWEIEQFHRELKQLTGSEKCQCRKQRSQRNHLANCYHAWLTLKRKARETGQTVYALKNGLLKEYLKQEMAMPRIPAYQMG